MLPAFFFLELAIEVHGLRTSFMANERIHILKTETDNSIDLTESHALMFC